jgi:hypothetical protein
MTNQITYVLIGVSILSILSDAINQIGDQDPNQKVFKTVLPFRIVTILCLLASLASGWYYLVTDNPTKDALLTLSWMFALFGIPLAIMVLGVRVVLEEDAIVIKSLLRPSKRILFSDIESLKYSESMKWYTVKKKDGTSRHISIWMKGSGQLIQTIKSKINYK